jgi:hypothetical protein
VSPGERRQQGNGIDPERGKKRENGKKMFFRGNELSYLLQTKDLAF